MPRLRDRAWIRRDILEKDPFYKTLMDGWRVREKTYNHEAELEKHKAAMEKWKPVAAKARAEGKMPPKPPRAPTNALTGQQRPRDRQQHEREELIPVVRRHAVREDHEQREAHHHDVQHERGHPHRTSHLEGAKGHVVKPFTAEQVIDQLKAHT